MSQKVKNLQKIEKPFKFFFNIFFVTKNKIFIINFYLTSCTKAVLHSFY